MFETKLKFLSNFILLSPNVKRRMEVNSDKMLNDDNEDVRGTYKCLRTIFIQEKFVDLFISFVAKSLMGDYGNIITFCGRYCGKSTLQTLIEYTLENHSLSYPIEKYGKETDFKFIHNMGGEVKLLMMNIDPYKKYKDIDYELAKELAINKKINIIFFSDNENYSIGTQVPILSFSKIDPTSFIHDPYMCRRVKSWKEAFMYILIKHMNI